MARTQAKYERAMVLVMQMHNTNNFSQADLQGIADMGQMMVAVKTGRMSIADAKAKAQALLHDATTSPVMRAQAQAMLNILATWEADQ